MPTDYIFPLTNPGIVSIVLGFLTMIVVSLLTQKKAVEVAKPVQA